MAIARRRVNELFIHIDDSFVVTSKPDYYNCIAYALGYASGFIWPSGQDGDWPSGIPCTERISSFTEMLGRHGYTLCATSTLEDGYEKIALYSKDGFVKHAARQLNSGRWTSKLGYAGYDIAHHGLGDLEGKRYGFAKHFFRRVLTDS